MRARLSCKTSFCVERVQPEPSKLTDLYIIETTDEMGKKKEYKLLLFKFAGRE